MLALPDVSLVLIETREHSLAALALRDCLCKAEFGDVLVFTDNREAFSDLTWCGKVRFIEVPDWSDKLGWSKCFWYEVPKHVHTSHALGIQWDSWIVAPEMWRHEYLETDYIGAPWPFYKDGLAVGNGGFSLRSTRMMRYIRRHRDKFPCNTDIDDNLYCRKYRPILEDAGFIWAAEPMAYDFAFECDRPNPEKPSFGFHAAANFDYGCEGDEDRLMERAQLMVRSDYIKNSYIWQNFKNRCPRVVDKLKEISNG